LPIKSIVADNFGARGQISVANVDHGEKCEAPKPTRELCRQKEGLDNVNTSVPLSFDQGKLPMNVEQCAFNCEASCTIDLRGCRVVEDGVVVNIDAVGIMFKRGDGGEDLVPREGGIGLKFEDDINDCGRGLTGDAGDATAAGDVGS